MAGASLPPGFRFHPTDEELVEYYLKRKVEGLEIELEGIPVIDLYKFDPWELPEKSFHPNRDMECFFFCPRDCKYPNGSRPNRATRTGYWKATGKDRKVMCQSSVAGYRKTLVFYRGRAPLWARMDWVMHEYRLCDDVSLAPPSFQGPFALCRIMKKNGDLEDKLVGGSSSNNGSSASTGTMNEPMVNPDDMAFQASFMGSESNYASPIASPYQSRPMMDYEPASMGPIPSSQWVSPDLILDSSKREREELQNKVTGEVVVDNGSNVFGAKRNDIGLAWLDKRVEILEEERENEVGKELFVEVTKSATNVEITTILPPPMPESLQNEMKMVELSGDEVTMDSVTENVRKVIVPEQNDVAVTSDREHETNELSHEVLKQNLGKVLEDDANSLGVRKKELNVAISKKKSSVAVTATSNLNHVKDVGEERFVEAVLNDEITTAVSPTPESLQNGTEVLQLLDESPMEAVTKNEVNGIEVVQLSDDESTGETAIMNESNVLVADQNNLAATSSERICRVGTSKSAHKIIESSQEDLKQHYGEKLDDNADGLWVRKNELNVAIAKQSCVPVITSSGRISGRAEASEKIEYRTTDILIRREDLIKHFGEKLDDVAAFFNVSRSSVQRACRSHGIGKWPLPMKKKVNASSTSNLKHRKEVVPKKRKKKVNPSSTSNLKLLKEVVPKKMKEVSSPSNSNLEHVKEAVPKKRKEVNAPSNLQHVKEFVPKKKKKVNASSTSNLEHVKEVVPKKRKKGNPSCSTSPPLHTTAAAVVARTIRNAPPEQDVGIMDTKVKYGNTTLRFDLPVTARKRDLMEMVTQRLPLNGVSFDIEYRDEENEWILIAIDKDLENGIGISRSMGKSPMLVLKITNRVP